MLMDDIKKYCNFKERPKTKITIVARQNPRGIDWRFFIICRLLGSLESPPSIMVTRNLWSARV